MSKFKIILLALLSLFASCQDNQNVRQENVRNYYRIFVGDRYGFIDDRGNIVIEPQYSYAETSFLDGLCYVNVEGKRGFINKDGRFEIELPDSIISAKNFVCGFSVCSTNDDMLGNTFVIDKQGNIVVPREYDDISIQVDGNQTYIVAKRELSVIIRGEELEILPSKCDCFVVNQATSSIEESYSLNSEFDDLSIPQIYFNGRVSCFKRRSGRYGYIAVNGTIAIDTVYDYARAFSEEGLARVIKGQDHFFIDRSGNKVFTVDSALTGFTRNRAAVILDGEKYLIDKCGNKVCSLDIDKIHFFKQDDYCATIIKDGRASKIDSIGNFVLSTHYDYIGAFIDGIAPVQKNYKWGFIDNKGDEIIDVIYDSYAFHSKDYGLRAVMQTCGDQQIFTYYNLQGEQIWTDVPSDNVDSINLLVKKRRREDLVHYYDAKLSNLDPIEGIYYVTIKDYYQKRDNPDIIGLNSSESKYYAIVKIDEKFYLLPVNDSGIFRNNLIQVGDSNVYAIKKTEGLIESDEYWPEGVVTIEDHTHFDFRLDFEHNNWYNFFATYEFVKDYPHDSEYSKIQNVEWTGTGFAISDGYIVTNYHVTSGATNIFVRGINGDMNERYKAFVVAKDKEHDISILRIVDKDFGTLGTVPYQIGNTLAEVGDEIFVLGYPMAETMGNDIKLTDGIISSLSGYKGDKSMYQMTVPIQFGNSGGPVFDANGTIIGIVCGKHSNAENANYAIKISYLYTLLSNANLSIDLTKTGRISTSKRSSQVKQIQNYVYLIECSSK